MKHPMVAKNTIVTSKETIAPGKVFDAGSSKEAKLLREAGAAEFYTAPAESGQAEQEAAALIELIAQAKDVEELAGLVGDDEERSAVREAFAARMDELQAGA